MLITWDELDDLSDIGGKRIAAVGFVCAFATIPRPGPAKDLYTHHPK
jgi:hypothetical protein